MVGDTLLQMHYIVLYIVSPEVNYWLRCNVNGLLVVVWFGAHFVGRIELQIHMFRVNGIKWRLHKMLGDSNCVMLINRFFGIYMCWPLKDTPVGVMLHDFRYSCRHISNCAILQWTTIENVCNVKAFYMIWNMRSIWIHFHQLKYVCREYSINV